MPVATVELMPPEPISPEDGAEPKPKLSSLPELLDQLEEEDRAAYEARTAGRPLGAGTGLAGLDHLIGGYLQRGIHVVHGSPGAGKTALALQIAGDCGCPAVLVSCEMRPVELLRRHTARKTATLLGALKNGEMPPSDSLALARRAAEEAPHLFLADATRAYADTDFLLSAAARARGSAPDVPHFLLLIDSLHTWASGSPAALDEYARLAVHLTALREISQHLACAIVVVSERNRQSMEKGGISAGAGHRGIEYGAETVIDLDTAGTPDANGEQKMLLKVAKNRHGATGQIDMLFHGAFQRFRNASTDRT